MAEDVQTAAHRALVEQAKQAPGRVLIEARGRLQHADEHAGVLHWAEAVALFELGRNDEATEAFRHAIEAAQRQADRESLVWRIEISLAAAEAAEGRVDAALERLGRVQEHGDPLRRALVDSQTALLQLHSGAPASALDLLERSLPVLQEHPGEAAATARVLMNIGYCRLVLGELEGADAAHHEAVAVADSCGERLVSAGARQNLGYVASLTGDHPLALDHLADARAIYSSMGEPPRRNLATFFDDLAETYRRAGLVTEALRYARLCVWTTRTGGNVEKQADAEYRRARCLLDADHRDLAAAAARRAHSMYASAGREAMAARAEVLLLDADTESGDSSQRRVEVDRLASVLTELGWHADVRELRLREGDRRWRAGAEEEAMHHFNEASANAPASTLDDRLGLLYGRAAAATVAGRDAAGFMDRARTMVTAHRVHLADPELARSCARFVDRFRLCELTSVLRSADPVAVLNCEETWRSLRAGSRHAVPKSAALASLRALYRLDVDDRPEGFDRELAQLEREVQDHAMRIRPADASGSTEIETGFDAAAAVAWLEGRTFVEWIEATDGLYRITVLPTGELRLGRCGALSEIRHMVATLRRAHVALVQTPGPGSIDDAAQVVRRQGTELAARLLGEDLLATELAGEFVLAPSPLLVELPWAMLMLSGAGAHVQSIIATPSLGAWLSARSAGPSTRAVMLAGPRLTHSGRDAVAFGKAFGTAEIFEGGDATCDAAARAFLESEVLHVAAHGHLRNDNARFSSVELADGHLWLHEVDAAPHAPELVVLAVCDAARMISEQRGQGAIDTLLQRGAGTVVAPTMAVPDDQLATVFEHFYRNLPGVTPATALVSTVRDLSDASPHLWAVAHSVQCAGRAPRPAPILPAT